jgi:hypothetical protein
MLFAPHGRRLHLIVGCFTDAVVGKVEHVALQSGGRVRIKNRSCHALYIFISPWFDVHQKKMSIRRTGSRVVPLCVSRFSKTKTAMRYFPLASSFHLPSQLYHKSSRYSSRRNLATCQSLAVSRLIVLCTRIPRSRQSHHEQRLFRPASTPSPATNYRNGDCDSRCGLRNLSSCSMVSWRRR